MMRTFAEQTNRRLSMNLAAWISSRHPKTQSLCKDNSNDDNGQRGASEGM